MYTNDITLLLFEKKGVGDIVQIWTNEQRRQRGVQPTARARCEFVKYMCNDFFYKVVALEKI